MRTSSYRLPQAQRRILLQSTLLVAVSLLGFLNQTYAQSTLHIRLEDDSLHMPVSHVLISIQGTRLSAETNDSGEAILLIPFIGTHTLAVRKNGYVTAFFPNLQLPLTDSLLWVFAMHRGDSDQEIAFSPLSGEREESSADVRFSESRATARTRSNRTAGTLKAGSNAGFSVHGQVRSPGRIELDEVNSGAKSSNVSRFAISEVPQVNGGLSNRKPSRTHLFNTENYNPVVENDFYRVSRDPLSTFSIDVDVASYANMRRFLLSGTTPPPDAIRIEELINYFTYAYPEPADGQPFSITTEVGVCPWSASHRIVQIGLQGKHINKSNLPPSNLVFLIDVSGSMDEPDKLPLVQRALKLLVKELRPQDHVAIVTYAGEAGLVLPSTSGSEKSIIDEAIDRLEAGGSTAGGAGILLAYNVAKEHFLANGNNRVILATDGDFNVGVSSDGDLVRLMEDKRKDGIYISLLGVGTENLKDSKMEQIADKGNGNYAYLDNLLEAQKVLVTQLGGTLYTIANDVKIQVEFNPVEVQSYRLIGYEDRLLATQDFNNDKKDAGELGSGHSVTAVYEIVPKGAEIDTMAFDSLTYQNAAIRPDAYASGEMMQIKLRYKQPKDSTSRLIVSKVVSPKVLSSESSHNLGFAAAVAEFGMLLQHSAHAGTASLEQVISLAEVSRGLDSEGYRAEFIKLAKLSSLLDIQASR